MYDYKDKFKGVDDGDYGYRRSLYDILSLDPDKSSDWAIINSKYNAVNIHKVKIGGNTFTNYGQYQFLWEKTFVKQPERSADGSIGNLNSYATFLTPHLIIDFSIMSIDDYRAIMELIYGRNEYTVECYDPIYNKTIAVNMYFATEEMAKLHTIARVRFNGADWEDWIELVGVDEYKVELIGTNSDLSLVSVTYHLNPPASTGLTDMTYGETDVYQGEDVIIGGAASAITAETFDGAYKFSVWSTSRNPVDSSSRNIYLNNYAYTINTDIELYAHWQGATAHTLNYNYGLADAAIGDDYTYITSKSVAEGVSIGELPTVPTPSVKAKNLSGVEGDYYPYYNGAWYKTPIKASGSEPIKNNEIYWSKRDATIYLIYDTHSYALKLYLDGTLYQENYVAYGTSMNLPMLVRSGYTFDGWYYTADFKDGTKASGNMPPYDLTLYARWKPI